MTFLRIVTPLYLLFEHDLFGKPVSTFPDHALAASVSPAGHHSATAPFTAAESSAPAAAEAKAESDGRSGRLVYLRWRRAANDDDIIIGLALRRLVVDPPRRVGFVLDLW